MKYQLHHGDCLEVLASISDCSIDSVVCDPPYGLSFMGRKWDYDVPSEAIWRECLRVLKPGGHLLAFAGTRTQHRMAVRIEDAGFEIRDMIAWVYGSGFPKSMDVSKAIDKAAGAEREVLGYTANARPNRVGKKTKLSGAQTIGGEITATATNAARQWQGWGTALKPAMEPITVARKPLIETVAANVLKHGTGAINVDGCRVDGKPRTTHAGGNYRGTDSGRTYCGAWEPGYMGQGPSGRWPANVIHDGSDEVTALLGDAARFFYSPKASKADRDEGCDGLEARRCGGMSATQDASMLTGSGNERTTERVNHHPTVKPVDLMTYLCRLITPPGGTILDPFTGSGSTGKAAIIEDFKFIGIEREADYIEIAKARLEAAVKYRSEFLF